MNEHYSPTVAKYAQARYGLRNGFDGLEKQKAHKRHHPKVGAFFVPAVPLYGGCVWGTLGCAGFLLPRSVNPRTAATLNRLTAIRGSSSAKGAPPMNHAQDPSKSGYTITHAAAWKARAFAALRANSSLSVRLARYNAAMARARALEVQGGAQ